MSEFWEEKYKSIGVTWKFEPAESAIIACKLFTENGFHKVLIPGVGYGRNAKIFADSGMDVTGIEISATAIRLARESGLEFKIHRGPVQRMPFDKEEYDGIFCYALLHLLNQNDRRMFLKKCYDQLRPDGIMVFTLLSKEHKLYGTGQLVSVDRFRIEKGLTAFFYDPVSVEKEFGPYGLIEYQLIDEPVRHLESEEPMKLYHVTCRKKQYPE